MQAHLEGLALALATPDAENQGDLDLRQVHEVLCHVDGELVQERRADVEAVLCTRHIHIMIKPTLSTPLQHDHNRFCRYKVCTPANHHLESPAHSAYLDVVEGALRLAEVLLGRHDGVLCAAQALVALVQRVHHAAAAGDVLLQGGRSYRRVSGFSVSGTEGGAIKSDYTLRVQAKQVCTQAQAYTSEVPVCTWGMCAKGGIWRCNLQLYQSWRHGRTWSSDWSLPASMPAHRPRWLFDAIMLTLEPFETCKARRTWLLRMNWNRDSAVCAHLVHC